MKDLQESSVYAYNNALKALKALKALTLFAGTAFRRPLA